MGTIDLAFSALAASSAPPPPPLPLTPAPLNETDAADVAEATLRRSPVPGQPALAEADAVVLGREDNLSVAVTSLGSLFRFLRVLRSLLPLLFFFFFLSPLPVGVRLLSLVFLPRPRPSPAPPRPVDQATHTHHETGGFRAHFLRSVRRSTVRQQSSTSLFQCWAGSSCSTENNGKTAQSQPHMTCAYRCYFLRGTMELKRESAPFNVPPGRLQQKSPRKTGRLPVSPRGTARYLGAAVREQLALRQLTLKANSYHD